MKIKEKMMDLFVTTETEKLIGKKWGTQTINGILLEFPVDVTITGLHSWRFDCENDPENIDTWYLVSVTESTRKQLMETGEGSPSEFDSLDGYCVSGYSYPLENGLPDIDGSYILD